MNIDGEHHFSENPDPADVLVVGGGVAGSLAAALLGRAGFRVVLVDVHDSPPDEFRVEKVAGPQVATLARLGMADAIAAASTLVTHVVSADRGRTVDVAQERHFSFSYRELVRMVRGEVPTTVRFLIGRVEAVETGPDRQVVSLSDGRVLHGRLIVLATGQADRMRESLGIGRRTLVEGGTVAFGFDVVPAGAGAPGPRGLTYYGEDGRGGVDYLALLPRGDVLRANLFAFGDPRQGWMRDFRREPDRVLRSLLPGLPGVLGEFRVAEGRVSTFIMRLVGVERPERDGIVLIGDAFQTSCPAAGTGLSRLLVDVERLCTVHVPDWLATPGIGRDKIARFYADPLKIRSDSDAVAAARRRRAFALQPDLRSRLRRRASFLKRRVVAAIRSGARVRRPARDAAPGPGSTPP